MTCIFTTNKIHYAGMSTPMNIYWNISTTISLLFNMVLTSDWKKKKTNQFSCCCSSFLFPYFIVSYLGKIWIPLREREKKRWHGEKRWKVTNERFPSHAHKSVDTGRGNMRPPSKSPTFFPLTASTNHLSSFTCMQSWPTQTYADTHIHKNVHFLSSFFSQMVCAGMASPLLFTNLVVEQRSGWLAKQHVS